MSSIALSLSLRPPLFAVHGRPAMPPESKTALARQLFAITPVRTMLAQQRRLMQAEQAGFVPARSDICSSVDMRLNVGRPDLLGASCDGRETNFALFSANAEKVELCLFDAAGDREIARIALPER